MRIFKYLIAIWAAIAVYTLFAFLGGPKGLSAYNYLLAEREQQWSNIRDLEIINEELEKTRSNLLYDHDTLLVQARQMGYGYSDERFIRIVGLGAIKNSPTVTGKIYTAQEPDFISGKSLQIAAFCAGLMLFVFIFMLEIIDNKSK